MRTGSVSKSTKCVTLPFPFPRTTHRLQRQVYYFGGFGDHAAIGFLDMDLYRSSVPKTASPVRQVETVMEHVASHLRHGKALAIEDRPDEGIVFQREA